jgi:hypothetical protein
MPLVELLQQVARRRFSGRTDRRRRIEVWNRFVRIERRALKRRRQECAVPVIRADLRHAAGIGNCHERRQVLILGAEGVANPRAEAWKAVEREAGAHLVLGRAVRVRLAGQRMDEAQVVGQLGHVWQQVRDHLAALAAGAEFPRRTRQVAVLALKCDQLAIARQRLPVPLDQLRLEVPSINVTQRPGAEDDENLLSPGREVRRPRRVGPLGRPLWANRLRRRQPALGCQQSR